MQDYSGIIFLYANGQLCLGVNYYFSFINMNYPVDYSAIQGNSMSVVVFAPQSKIDTSDPVSRNHVDNRRRIGRT